MTAKLAAARKRDVRVITSAATIVEADPQGAHTARLAWALSRLVVEPVTKDTVKEAVARMKDSGRTGGHEYALDAIVAATARAAQPPVTVLTSDLDDLKPLCGKQVEVRQV
ncbi:DNA-binding protein [Streptomyces europaeiscabiei]|uniref:DNA-binding protein n=1 Tax=Streptomyces europaeiscabiei TaxID=146819 RepID=UPI0029BE4D2A|nr:DNA-binding protein [Streptomyces europaeiscabiei]